jgi:hypothetical protein
MSKQKLMATELPKRRKIIPGSWRIFQAINKYQGSIEGAGNVGIHGVTERKQDVVSNIPGANLIRPFSLTQYSAWGPRGLAGAPSGTSGGVSVGCLLLPRP